MARKKLQNGSKILSYRICKETFIFKQYFNIIGEQEYTKGAIRIFVYRRRTDNTMAKT